MGRCESSFIHLPDLGAKLYNLLMSGKGAILQYREIAQRLVAATRGGRWLDIGTGPGRLLAEIHKLDSEIELFGLDIAASMVELAGNNLRGINADLRLGNIRSTDYDDDFFDLVTCSGSFYLWDEPEEGLAEIFRILKPSASAYLFESHRNYNKSEFNRALKQNLAEKNLLRKMISPFFLRKQLRMTYTHEEVEAIVKRTHFDGSYRITPISLAGLPVWLEIKLTKQIKIGE